jgi:dTDP-4-dehydrorhamnose reductase
MNILTLGNGFASSHLPYSKILDRVAVNESFIDNMLDYYKPDTLINCIGKTGSPNVDWCESNKEITSKVNTLLPILLAHACEKRNIHLIHIGSGCIYYGDSPHYMYVGNKYFSSADKPNSIAKVDLGWNETDFANPAGFYSKTKYAADLSIGDMSNVTILRIRMPISSQNHPRNLINKLKGYSKIIDIPNSMTFMDDFVRCVDWAAKNAKTGIFNVVNSQPLTAVNIMREYQKYVPDHKFEVINEEELDKLTVAKRSNCVLDGRKLANAGFYMSLSRDALRKCMREYLGQ